MREWVGGIDGADMAALMAEDPSYAEETVADIFSCVPDLLIATVFAEWSVDKEDLIAQEVSCSLEWESGLVWQAVMAKDSEYLEDVLQGLISCAPTCLLLT